MTDVDERVARGVAVLTELVPSWRGRIDTSTLDMGNATRCVVGQVMDVEGLAPSYDRRSWAQALHALGAPEPGPHGWPTFDQRRWSIAHGFDVDVLADERYTVLTAAWRRELDA